MNLKKSLNFFLIIFIFIEKISKDGLSIVLEIKELA